MEWTQDIPTKPGYYWVQYEDSLSHVEDNAIVDMIYISDIRDDGELSLYSYYYEKSWDPNLFADKVEYWMGPIDIPESLK